MSDEGMVSECVSGGRQRLEKGQSQGHAADVSAQFISTPRSRPTLGGQDAQHAPGA